MDNAYPLVVIAPLAGLACNTAGHIAASILTAGRRIPLSLVAGFAAGLLLMAGLTALGLARMDSEVADTIAFTLLNLLTYLALSFGYFNFVNLNMTSLRIRVLLELHEATGGLSHADLLGRYNADELIARRIARLTAQGHLEERAGRYHLRSLSLPLLAAVITALKLIVCGHGNRTLQTALERDQASRERKRPE